MRVEVNRLQRSWTTFHARAARQSPARDAHAAGELDEVVEVVVAVMAPLANDAGVGITTDLAKVT